MVWLEAFRLFPTSWRTLTTRRRPDTAHTMWKLAYRPRSCSSVVYVRAFYGQQSPECTQNFRFTSSDREINLTVRFQSLSIANISTGHGVYTLV